VTHSKPIEATHFPRTAIHGGMGLEASAAACSLVDAVSVHAAMGLRFGPALVHPGFEKRLYYSLKERLASVGHDADLVLGGGCQPALSCLDLAQRNRLRREEGQHGPSSAHDCASP
jgi:hypothetical protein